MVTVINIMIKILYIMNYIIFIRSINIVKEVNNINNHKNDSLSEKIKFKVGDHVRIFKYKKHFDKGFISKWTNEIFIIKKILNTNPITYRIIDQSGEDIIGRFYTNELQRSNFK